MSGLAYQCPLCYRFQHEGRLTPEGERGLMICHNCAPDHLAVVKLYNEIIHARPTARNYTIDELFRKLWELVQRKGLS